MNRIVITAAGVAILLVACAYPRGAVVENSPSHARVGTSTTPQPDMTGAPHTVAVDTPVVRGTRRGPRVLGRPVESRDPTTGPIRIDLAALRRDVLREVNVARRGAGAPPLSTDARLDNAASRYSRELAQRREIEHVSSTPGLRTFRDRIHAAGTRPRQAGENLARLTATRRTLARRVVRAWLDSPGHRSNLLSRSWRRTGIGIMLGQDGIWYIVQYYATPD